MKKVKIVEGGRAKYYVHTHDLISYRRCRRKWALSSPLRMHLKPKATLTGVNPYLWMGSGFHFGLEDYYGHRRFNSAKEAFMEYVNAHPIEERPVDWENLVDLCSQMLDIYTEYEDTYGTWKTALIDGQPAVEINFALELEGITHEGQPVAFGGTIDRIVEDEHGRYWILDYKTAKAFDTDKLALDTQISAYCWAAEQYLGVNIEGMLYVQVHKSPPKAPKITKTGVSTDKRQRTTAKLYKEALLEFYNGDIDAIPAKNKEYYKELRKKEKGQIKSGLGNDYVCISWVERNTHTKINFFNHLYGMLEEMTNPNLSIYPNSTKDCSWDCSFRDICLAKEEGSDWEYYLSFMEERNETMDDEDPKWLITLKKKFPEKY